MIPICGLPPSTGVSENRTERRLARAYRLADSHGLLTVSSSDTAVDRRVRIGHDGGAVSAVVIDRSRTVLMERCRLIVR